jgi:hypothetical protein
MGGDKKSVRLLSGIHLWYSSGEKPLPIRWVLVFDPDKNEAEAFFSTDLQLAAEQIVHFFVLRWNIEVTFAEARAHLGMETQRQWSDKAIARTTPCLMALFSLVCLCGIEMLKSQALPILLTAWYKKNQKPRFLISWRSLGAVFGLKTILTTQRLRLTPRKLSRNSGKAC